VGDGVVAEGTPWRAEEPVGEHAGADRVEHDVPGHEYLALRSPHSM
jgi:hypothetical protein